MFLGLDLGLLVPALVSAKDTLINSLGLFTIILTPCIMVLWIKLTFKKKQIKQGKPAMDSKVESTTWAK